MKVIIKKYCSWWGPYQISDLLQKVGVSEDTCHRLGEKLSNTCIMDICNWIESKKKRKVKIRIDEYDVWSMDHTLSYIVLPMLIKLKETQQGHGMVDDEDVPEEIRSYNAPPKDNEYEWDDFSSKRWDWIIDEMIWAFEQIQDDSWEDQYHSGTIDIQWKPADPVKYLQDDETKEELFEMVTGPKDTHVFDREGWTKHNERISNGCRLFGKYLRSLWT